MDTQRMDTTSRIATGISLTAAPLLLAVGFALHPAESKDGAAQLQIVVDHTTRWNLAHLFILLGVVAFTPATYGILRLLRGTGIGIGVAGGITMAIGVVFFGALIGVDALAPSAFASLPADQRAALTPAMQALIDTKGATPLVYLGIVGFLLALLLLAVALFVSRTVPRWTSGVIVLAGLVMVAGLDNVKILAVGAVVLLIGMGAIGIDTLRNARGASLGSPRVQGDVTPAHP